MPLNGIRERRLEVVRRRRQSAASAKRRTAVAHPSDPTVSGPFEQFAETFAGTHDAAEPVIELIDCLQPVVGIDVRVGNKRSVQSTVITVWIDTAFDGFFVFPRTMIARNRAETSTSSALMP